MKLYDESELQASIEAGERKLAVARQRKRQTRRWFVGGSILLLLLVPLGVAMGVVAGQAPPSPFLVVSWPKPKVEQVLASGQTVLARRGQPFKVSVSDSENWDVTWLTGSVESRGGSVNWDPASADDRLKAHCRPLASGLAGLFSFLWPTREVDLHCVVAAKVPRYENGAVNQYTQVLKTGGEGAWIAPHIFAAGQVAWDERALPLLASSVTLLPDAALGAELAQGSRNLSPRTWQIVSDFEGQSREPALEGTFALLRTLDMETVMPQVATHIIQKAPTISLKFIVRLDKDPREGIVRLAFDGKSQRLAWVRRAGQRAGTPLTGWEKGELGSITPGLPPAPPRR